MISFRMDFVAPFFEYPCYSQNIGNNGRKTNQDDMLRQNLNKKKEDLNTEFGIIAVCLQFYYWKNFSIHSSCWFLRSFPSCGNAIVASRELTSFHVSIDRKVQCYWKYLNRTWFKLHIEFNSDGTVHVWTAYCRFNERKKKWKIKTARKMRT